MNRYDTFEGVYDELRCDSCFCGGDLWGVFGGGKEKESGVSV